MSLLVHTVPHEHRWAPDVQASQLTLDFSLPSGDHVGKAVILAMPDVAFVLHVQVAASMLGMGYGLDIHRIIAHRYGGVACETHCSTEEMRVWEAMARRRSVWAISLAPGPRVDGVPAIVRSGAGVHQMLVGRLSCG